MHGQTGVWTLWVKAKEGNSVMLHHALRRDGGLSRHWWAPRPGDADLRVRGAIIPASLATTAELGRQLAVDQGRQASTFNLRREKLVPLRTGIKRRRA